VILTGTNDLGRATGGSPQSIAEDVIALRVALHDAGTPTIAVVPAFAVPAEGALTRAILLRI
jgi:hypothetical protein